jgi:hypothetical protein
VVHIKNFAYLMLESKKMIVSPAEMMISDMEQGALAGTFVNRFRTRVAAALPGRTC